MLTSAIAFIVAFGLLVLVHEFGHFWVAKKTGVTVEAFSIGFGPKILKWRWGGTEFCISLIPLGGYVKMKGESEEEEGMQDAPDAFFNKPIPARSGIVLAGPMMNLVLSFVLMPLVFWIGKPEPQFFKEPPIVERVLPSSPASTAGLTKGDRIQKINGEETPTWENLLKSLSLLSAGKEVVLDVEHEGEAKEVRLTTAPFGGGAESYIGIEKFFGASPPAEIKEVISESPAAKAEIQKGDIVQKLNHTVVENWDHLVTLIQSSEGKESKMELNRQGQTVVAFVKPEWSEAEKRWRLGIQGPDPKANVSLSIYRYGFLEGLQMGFRKNFENLKLTFAVLYKLFTREFSYKNLGGPVQIAYVLAEASASGLADFLYFTAFLSLQLGVLNLLPIPVLDGGHLTFYAIEAIRGKPLSLKIRSLLQQVGMILLLTLITFVTWNDLKRLFF